MEMFITVQRMPITYSIEDVMTEQECDYDEAVNTILDWARGDMACGVGHIVDESELIITFVDENGDEASG